MLAVKESMRLKEVKPEIVNLSSMEGNCLLYIFQVHTCILVYAPFQAHTDTEPVLRTGEKGKGLGMTSHGRKQRMHSKDRLRT